MRRKGEEKAPGGKKPNPGKQYLAGHMERGHQTTKKWDKSEGAYYFIKVLALKMNGPGERIKRKKGSGRLYCTEKIVTSQREGVIVEGSHGGGGVGGREGLSLTKKLSQRKGKRGIEWKIKQGKKKKREKSIEEKKSSPISSRKKKASSKKKSKTNQKTKSQGLPANKKKGKRTGTVFRGKEGKKRKIVAHTQGERKEIT